MYPLSSIFRLGGLRKRGSPKKASIPKVRGGVTPEGDIPRYPPFVQGIPAATVDDILDSQARLVDDVCKEVGLPQSRVETLVMPVIRNYAAFAHLLPASEAHHHRGAGGLFRHGLEVSLWATRMFRGCVVETDQPPSIRKDLEPRWRFAVFVAGIAHDIGKPLTDIRVVDQSGKRSWHPYLENLASWLDNQGIDRYFIRWEPERHRRHEVVGPAVVHQILTPDAADFIHSGGGRLEGVIHRYLAASEPHRKELPLYQSVKQADTSSVQRDLAGQGVAAGEERLSVPVAKYLVDAIRRLIVEGKWVPNRPPSPLWILDSSFCALEWPRAAAEICELLRSDGVRGIPSDPTTVAEILYDHGLAGPQGEDLDAEGEALLETITPLAAQRRGEDKRVDLRVLRFSSKVVGDLSCEAAAEMVVPEPPSPEPPGKTVSEPMLGVPPARPPEAPPAPRKPSRSAPSEAAAPKPERSQGEERKPPEASQAPSTPASDQRRSREQEHQPPTPEKTASPSQPSQSRMESVPEGARPLVEAALRAGKKEGMSWLIPVSELPGAAPGLKPLQIVTPLEAYLEPNPDRPMTLIHKDEKGAVCVMVKASLGRIIGDLAREEGSQVSEQRQRPSARKGKKAPKQEKAQEGEERQAQGNGEQAQEKAQAQAKPPRTEVPPAQERGEAQAPRGAPANHPAEPASKADTDADADAGAGAEVRDSILDGFFAWVRAEAVDMIVDETPPKRGVDVLRDPVKGVFWLNYRKAIKRFAAQVGGSPAPINGRIIDSGLIGPAPEGESIPQVARWLAIKQERAVCLMVPPDKESSDG